MGLLFMGCDKYMSLCPFSAFSSRMDFDVSLKQKKTNDFPFEEKLKVVFIYVITSLKNLALLRTCDIQIGRFP